MKQKVKGNSFKIIILLSVYYSLLLWIYEKIVSPRFSYTGLVNESSEDGFYLSILGVAFTIFTFIIIDKKNQPSSLIMNLFNLLFFIPMYVFVAYKQIVSGYYLFLILYQLSLFLFYILIPFSFRPLIPRSEERRV